MVHIKQVGSFFVCLFGICFCAVAQDGREDNNLTPVARGFDASSLLSSLTQRGFTSTASGASQVVSLNLTNLLVLVLLKALIFAAGSLGAGAWKGGYARSIDEGNEIVNEQQAFQVLSYLTGTPENSNCFKNMVCKEPQKSTKYFTASDVMLRVWKMFSVEPDPVYGKVLKDLEFAANRGLAGTDCDSEFQCNM